MSDTKTTQRPLPPLATALAVVFAIGAPSLQALTGWGLSAAEFAQDGQSTLRAASYAFSIWTLIYVWLAAYALYRLRSAPSAIDNALALPATIAIIGCGLWIVAAAADMKLATIGVIIASALVLGVGLLRAGAGRASRAQWLWIVAPLSLLTGWLTIASALNTLTVATASGWLSAEMGPIAAATGIALVAAIGFAVASRRGLGLFVVSIAWGLAGVVVAEASARPLLALLAAVASAAVLTGAVIGVLMPASDPIVRGQRKARPF